MPLVTKVVSVSSQSSQSRTRNTSLILIDSKVTETPTFMETGKTNKGQLFVPTEANEKTVGPQDVLLHSWCVSSINPSGSRRKSQADSNSKHFF